MRKQLEFGFTAGDLVLITGAGSGIGRATAVRAAELGLSVAAWDLDQPGVAQTAELITRAGGRVLPVLADVGDAAAVERGFCATRREFGEIRYLVNNAGPSSASEIEFDAGVRIAVGSVRRMTETWLSEPVPPGAALVNIASVAGNFLGTASDWYSASKAAIAGYTRHLAGYRSDEVRSNAVAPGMVDTPRLRGFAASEVGQRSLQLNPMGRMAVGDDIAFAILFLLSPLATYINGVVLPVDGGWLIAQ
ncbi:SDR family NAD(P)-dependent oxidoreductase [Sciscionella marina]|uniref:SDR family NAD(P)-dependent oxidoreductase n=1 Tax=Sciscionella marina TaxID=508770 RepID=UPI0003775895|nr:SDR family oxidoreductase [Sciscionella marina]